MLSGGSANRPSAQVRRERGSRSRIGLGEKMDASSQAVPNNLQPSNARVEQTVLLLQGGGAPSLLKAAYVASERRHRDGSPHLSRRTGWRAFARSIAARTCPIGSQITQRSCAVQRQARSTPMANLKVSTICYPPSR